MKKRLKDTPYVFILHCETKEVHSFQNRLLLTNYPVLITVRGMVIRTTRLQAYFIACSRYG